MGRLEGLIGFRQPEVEQEQKPGQVNCGNEMLSAEPWFCRGETQGDPVRSEKPKEEGKTRSRTGTREEG